MAFDPHVDLFIDGAWVDITAFVVDERVVLVEGQDDELAEVSYARTALTLDNDDRRFSNRNPTSLYYGKIGRNTPLRVRDGATVVWIGEVHDWPQTLAPGSASLDGDPGTHVRVPIEAAGILRRLSQGAKKVLPPLYRKIISTGPVGFWPLDDKPGVATIRSAVDGVPAMQILPLTTSTFAGNPPASTVDEVAQLASIAGPDGSDAVNMVSARGGGWPNGVFKTPTLSLTDTGVWAHDFWFKYSAVGADNSGVFAYLARWTTTGNPSGRTLFYVFSDTGVATPTLVVTAATSDDLTFTNWTFTSPNIFDQSWHYVRVSAQTAGSDLTLKIWIDGQLRQTATVAGSSPGAIATTAVPGYGSAAMTNLLQTLGVSSFAIYNSLASSPADIYGAGTGYTGETAGRRIERLCGEEGVAFASVGNLDDTAAMGLQGADTLLNLLLAARDADRGILHETCTELGLTYRTRVSLYNQYGPVLDYRAQQISILGHTDNDRLTHNDVTVERIGGASARSTLDIADGVYHTLTTQPPPAGVGTYDRGVIRLSLAADDQAQMIAAWIRHLGTWDEMRYPLVGINLISPAWVNNPTGISQMLAQRPGDAVFLANLPSWLPPDLAQVQIRGRQVVMSPVEGSITWVTMPGWPWEVGVVDSGGSTLAKAVLADTTTFKLDTSAGPPWSVDDEPYYIQLGGDASRVTSMVTDSIGTPVAGAVSFNTNGPVTPALPAGVAEGDALFCVGFVGNQAAGASTPAGYALKASATNLRLFGKYASASESAPTVSFTGTGASDITGAFTFRVPNCSIQVDSSAIQTNSSAQNINYPALSIRRDFTLLLILGEKQHSWTSVATLAGMTELVDSSSATGNEVGIVADYLVEGAGPISVPAGSFVVTGGVAAVGRGMTVALRPTQSATVVRGINNAATLHAVGTAAHTWRAGVNAL